MKKVSASVLSLVMVVMVVVAAGGCVEGNNNNYSSPLEEITIENWTKEQGYDGVAVYETKIVEVKIRTLTNRFIHRKVAIGKIEDVRKTGTIYWEEDHHDIEFEDGVIISVISLNYHSYKKGGINRIVYGNRGDVDEINFV